MEGTKQQPVVWVTGGAGYIGSNVVRALLDTKVLPIVIDNFSTGTDRFLQKGVPHTDSAIGSSNLEEDMRDLTERYGKPRAVIHLAAKTDVGWCEKNPVLAYEGNVVATYNIANLAAQLGCKEFTFISSAAVYGNLGKKRASTEGAWLQPAGVYGQTKLDAEKMLNSYFKNILNTTVFRLFNVAGAGIGNSLNIAPRGKPDPDSQALIPSMVRNYLRGSNISMNECAGLFLNHSPVRDFVHVSDVARIVSSLTLMPVSRFYGTEIQVFNVGRGIPVKISDLLQLTKYSKEELRDKVSWYSTSAEEIRYSVAGKWNVGNWGTRTLAQMWADEVRWQKSKLYQQIKSDKSKEKKNECT